MFDKGDAKAEERFKAVAAANGLLSDVEKRGRFDREHSDAMGQQPQGGQHLCRAARGRCEEQQICHWGSLRA